MLGQKCIVFLFIIVICIVCTSYEYIINVSVGSRKYATFLGFEVIAQLKDSSSNSEENLSISSAKSDNEINLRNSTQENTASKDAKVDSVSKQLQDEQISFQINNQTLAQCREIPSGLQGKLKVSTEVLNISSIVFENKEVLVGGEWSPLNCSSRHNVALVVPYRDRLKQLAVFLRHIHPFLRRQDIHYRIYIINQVDQHLFNRAMLMNVGFAEAMKDFPWDCCIFHDVDLLPEDDRNLYTCPSQPRHMSVAVDKFKYRLPYKTIFGGVAAINTSQFKKLNGFSNQFWGWGGEDDDMAKRIHFHKLRITRYQPEIARYTMIKHKQQTVNKERARVLRSSHRRYKIDGLNSLKYEMVFKQLLPLFTNISVKLKKEELISMKRTRLQKLIKHIHKRD